MHAAKTIAQPLNPGDTGSDGQKGKNKGDTLISPSWPWHP
jgi:hypothetical protein